VTKIEKDVTFWSKIKDLRLLPAEVRRSIHMSSGCILHAFRIPSFLGDISAERGPVFGGFAKTCIKTPRKVFAQ
jgi:hypothetical protein